MICLLIVIEVISNNLSELIRYLAVSQSYLPLFVGICMNIHSSWASTSSITWLYCRSMREQSFVDLQQSLFVVHKQIKQIALITHSEICQFDSVLGQLSQSQKRLLKFASLIGILFDLLKLFLVINFVLKSAFHDVLANLLNTVDKEAF